MKNRLKLLRKALGLTQIEFSKRLNVHQTAVSCWEKGTTTIPYYKIDFICEQFHVSKDWLVNGIGEMFSQDSPTGNYDDFIKTALDILNSLDKEKRDIMIELAKRLVNQNQSEKEEKEE